MSPESDLEAPRVSVCMVTFQHADFIDQAIASVVEQDEPRIELVVGDDQSPDDTLAKARAWQKRYPSIVRVLDPTPEKLLGRLNFSRTLKACRGQYISHLDGDDWFLAPHKLRIQADLLDAHPEHSGCLTASQEFDFEGNPAREPDRISTAKGFLTTRNFLRTNRACSSAAMWRRGLVDHFPDWWWTTPVGDWPMHLLHLEHGSYGYIDENLAAHRLHPGGVWSHKSEAQRLDVVLGCQSDFMENLSAETLQAERASFLYWQWRQAKKMMRAGDHVGALRMTQWLAPYARYLDPFTRWRIASHSKRLSRETAAANGQ